MQFTIDNSFGNLEKHDYTWCCDIIGVFSMEGSSKHSVTLDVMPLVCGFLPLPAVRLSRYIPAEHKPKGMRCFFAYKTKGLNPI